MTACAVTRMEDACNCLGGRANWLFKIHLSSFIAKSNLYLLLLVATDFYKTQDLFVFEMSSFPTSDLFQIVE